MTDILSYILAFAAGLILGYAYFAGLWWTVQRITQADRPVLLGLASFFIRTTMIMGAVYLVSAGSWIRLLACVAGFFGMRTVLLLFYSPAKKISAPPSGPGTKKGAAGNGYQP